MMQMGLMRKAISYVARHYERDITVQDIAGHCNINRIYLRRIFKLTLGTTLRQYIINYRIKKACDLLTEGVHSIGEISVMVGYPNQLNFSRAFKRELGISPYNWKIGRVNH